MRGMNSESVDLIYLDPPFNSNKTYEAPIGSKAAGAAFKDAWTLSDIDVCEHGELADRSPAAHSVIDAARAAHGKSMQSYLIFMAVRLLEMKRILSSEGSIYLHCDPTANQYLKLLMDAIFEARNYRSAVVWKRATSKQKGSQHAPKSWGTNTDIILFYSKTDALKLRPYGKLTLEERLDKFRHVDENGERYYPDNSHIWSTPGMGDRPNLCYEWRGFRNPHPSGWRLSKERLEEEYQKGNFAIIEDPATGQRRLERRKYERDYPGKPIGNLWDDIPPAMGDERTGYPTQKPLALLERIIRASSGPEDFVFDPFCGCATALVAADNLGRQWAGIDLSPKAVELVNTRIAEQGRERLWKGAIVREDIPQLTDTDEVPDYRTHKHRLYGEQEGICKGCDLHFPFRNMTIDHELPRARGGTDHYENLQLLCGACNSSKGDRTMAEWRAAQGCSG